MKDAVLDGTVFDEVFPDGEFTENRIEAAGLIVTYLAQTNKAEARRARRLLGEMLLFAIADHRCSNPQGCAADYYEAMRAAFGEPLF